MLRLFKKIRDFRFYGIIKVNEKTFLQKQNLKLIFFWQVYIIFLPKKYFEEKYNQRYK